MNQGPGQTQREAWHRAKAERAEQGLHEEGRLAAAAKAKWGDESARARQRATEEKAQREAQGRQVERREQTRRVAEVELARAQEEVKRAERVMSSLRRESAKC